MHLHHFQYEQGSNPEDADSSLGGHFPSPTETVQNPTRIRIRHNSFCGWVGWTVFRWDHLTLCLDGPPFAIGRRYW